MLQELEKWYENCCDGEWEHHFGVTIETLDNPGWQVRIDIVGTRLENQGFKEVNWSDDHHDWLRCRVREGRFEGVGGPAKLHQILKVFTAWASGTVDQS